MWYCWYIQRTLTEIILRWRLQAKYFRISPTPGHIFPHYFHCLDMFYFLTQSTFQKKTCIMDSVIFNQMFLPCAQIYPLHPKDIIHLKTPPPLRHIFAANPAILRTKKHLIPNYPSEDNFRKSPKLIDSIENGQRVECHLQTYSYSPLNRCLISAQLI